MIPDLARNPEMIMKNFFALAAFVVITSCAAAQFSGPGLLWSGTSGSGAGELNGFTCTPDFVGIVGGETVTISVWGDYGAPFWLLGSLSATQCQTIPGVNNSLLVDPVITIAEFGYLTLATPCLACPPGHAQFVGNVPVGLPPGIPFAIQALTFAAGAPTFSGAIVAITM